MQLTPTELRRVARRLDRIKLRFWGAIIILPLQLVVMASSAIVNLPRGDWSVFASTSLITCTMIGVCIYQLRTVGPQYMGLRRDLKVQQKQIVIAPLRRKFAQRDRDGENFYLRFDIGTIQCGEKLFHRLNPGDMLTLTVTRYGRELLAVDRADFHPGPSLAPRLLARSL